MKFSVFLLAIPLFAVIDGSVINRTTGKPQRGATVTVYKLGTAGIESLESVKTDAAGRFSFTADPGPGPALLQGAWDGVTYNKMLTPNTPRTGSRWTSGTRNRSPARPKWRSTWCCSNPLTAS